MLRKRHGIGGKAKSVANKFVGKLRRAKAGCNSANPILMRAVSDLNLNSKTGHRLRNPLQQLIDIDLNV
jgi:hypothetical protein